MLLYQRNEGTVILTLSAWAYVNTSNYIGRYPSWTKTWDLTLLLYAALPPHCSSEIFSARFVPCSYAALLADWPVVVLGMCTLLIVVCALVGVLVPELPDFSDPLLVRRT